jgi:1,4-alpha-glucan branching enzyme
MWTFPGKKLLFMGGEIAQWNEWRSDGSIEWDLIDFPLHRGVQSLIADLNRLYVERDSIHGGDSDPGRFQWLAADDSGNSVYAFVRWGRNNDATIVASNFTPVPRFDYRITAPKPGAWREALNTDAEVYGGGNIGNGGAVFAPEFHDGHRSQLSLTLPPLATIVLASDGVN